MENYKRTKSQIEGAVNSLQELCLKYCVLHLETISRFDDDGNYILQDGITLPAQICESLFNKYIEQGYVISDHFLHLFKETSRTKLQRVNLRDSEISDDGFRILAQHGLVEVDISFCQNLSEETIHLINKHCQNLRVLHLKHVGHLFSDIETLPYNNMKEICKKQVFGSDYIFNCPEMRVLSLNSVKRGRVDDIIGTMLNQFDKLNHLDLSSCDIEVCGLYWLENKHSLVSLVLYNIRFEDFERVVDSIVGLKHLRHLDISQNLEKAVVKYPDAALYLRRLVSELPNLRSLDLSGTDLPGVGPIDNTCVSHRLDPSTLLKRDEIKCPFAGLEGRYFDFLGLFQCPDSACHRANIPAKLVTGDANEDQLTLTVTMYVDRISILMKALDKLFLLLRTIQCENPSNALEALLMAMRRHPREKKIQISASASVFYLVRQDRRWMSLHEKRATIKVILDAMENHPSEDTMIRNCGLTLCQFNIPQDMLYHYERIVRVLLNVIDPNSGIYATSDEFVQRIGIYLLNSLACQVDGREKQLVGDLGAVQMMLKVIESKLRSRVCDEILEVAWSTMWNITDETPRNCCRFLDGCGMEYFIRCLEEFPDKQDLLRNMMGLMGNVAENIELRPKLMQPEYVSVFSKLLDSDSDGIEVSYNASGVLAHMASDGEIAWNLDQPSREETLRKMIDAIERWDINTSRNINYRSFEPILRLLDAFETPASQHWATWALCNLTTVYPQKYCKLIEKENGKHLLENVLNHPRSNQRIKEYAFRVLENIRQFNAMEVSVCEDDGFDR